MRRWMWRVLAGVAAVVAFTIGAATVAQARGDDEGTLTGPDADRATQAALQITGGGTANAVERDSEDGATYEVEVTRPDGSTVDVRLDASFRLVVVEDDSDADER